MTAENPQPPEGHKPETGDAALALLRTEHEAQGHHIVTEATGRVMSITDEGDYFVYLTLDSNRPDEYMTTVRGEALHEWREEEVGPGYHFGWLTYTVDDGTDEQVDVKLAYPRLLTDEDIAAADAWADEVTKGWETPEEQARQDQVRREFPAPE